jgi:pimeloyl-ACP methyl ester carboxylesterase
VDELAERIMVPYEDHEKIPAAGGAELYYESYGAADGPVITTVNNFYLIAQAWRGFTEPLTDSCRVVAWDLRGQGGSSRGEGPLQWDQLVEDLLGVLDHLEIERTYLLGSSISCLLVRDFATRYPDRVRGCIMQAPAFSPYGSKKRDMVATAWLQTLAAYGTEELWQHLYAEAYSGSSQEQLGTAGYLAVRQMFTQLHDKEQLAESIKLAFTVADGPEPLQQLTCPVLLQLGDADFMWGRSQAEDALALLPRGQLDIIPRAGHVATMEQPEEFAASVQRFIDAVEAGEV